MMFWFCIFLGVMMIAIGLSLIVMEIAKNQSQKLPRKMAKPLSEKKKRRLLASREARQQTIECEINLDSFAGIAALPQLSMNDIPVTTCLEYASGQEPVMQLASLMEIQSEEQIMRETSNRLLEMPKIRTQSEEPEKTRMLGDAARDLGIAYFDELIEHRVVPRGNVSATNETNLVIARNALKSGRESAILSHGAVAQRIGEKTICVFEPLEKAVDNISAAVDSYAEILQGRIAFFVLESTDAVDPAKLRHINPICKRYNIPKTNIFIHQADHSFVNYIEDVNNYVPSRIDVARMPAQFFSDLFDYVEDAYNQGDNETVLRVLGPLLGDLYSRVQFDRRFDKRLAADAFNLMGMTNRELGYDEQAIRCFEASLSMLRAIEAYDDIKSVLANLGITHALIQPATQQHIEQAIRHLNEVTQLNPYDDESWTYLANSYLVQFRMTKRTSLLHHALRAYERAEALSPTPEISMCVKTLRDQLNANRNQFAAAAQARGGRANNVYKQSV